MKNFPITIDNGETYWISRAVTTAAFVFCEYDGKQYILANKRGSGLPDFVGYWNCPCGYLDFNETVAEACSRELYEETGVTIPSSYLELFYINDNPHAVKQNITFRYKYDFGVVETLPTVTDTNAEKDEIAEIKWICVDNIDEYNWAFNHNNIIKEIL